MTTAERFIILAVLAALLWPVNSSSLLNPTVTAFRTVSKKGGPCVYEKVGGTGLDMPVLQRVASFHLGAAMSRGGEGGEMPAYTVLGALSGIMQMWMCLEKPEEETPLHRMVMAQFVKKSRDPVADLKAFHQHIEEKLGRILFLKGKTITIGDVIEVDLQRCAEMPKETCGDEADDERWPIVDYFHEPWRNGKPSDSTTVTSALHFTALLLDFEVDVLKKLVEGPVSRAPTETPASRYANLPEYHSIRIMEAMSKHLDLTATFGDPKDGRTREEYEDFFKAATQYVRNVYTAFKEHGFSDDVYFPAHFKTLYGGPITVQERPAIGKSAAAAVTELQGRAEVEDELFDEAKLKAAAAYAEVSALLAKTIMFFKEARREAEAANAETAELLSRNANQMLEEGLASLLDAQEHYEAAKKVQEEAQEEIMTAVEKVVAGTKTTAEDVVAEVKGHWEKTEEMANDLYNNAKELTHKLTDEAMDLYEKTSGGISQVYHESKEQLAKAHEHTSSWRKVGEHVGQLFAGAKWW
ncbi:unnamed protein product [Vitrella brassicaformis CCMP3155]|uniref:Uncharacterized protein n=2 Tax=Vitrella brassicaformis TaxID=1169539 RepID=A0A0G4EDE5_VITBC|nr:unnamed protein product [Vitrella brassicaformis CCMP3155]|eukprot:CEL93725.1 unnamed protein product [Vitrella brassicaformis CCMP3155]